MAFSANLPPTLAARILALLSLAFLPIGAIAVYQTAQLSTQLRAQSEAGLLSATFESVKTETAAVERAYGAAQAMGAITSDMVGDPARCSAEFRRFMKNGLEYAFAGILPPSGIVTCSSAPGPVDLSQEPSLAQRFKEGVPWADASAQGRTSGLPVIVIAQPYYRNGKLLYFVVLSIPQILFEARHDRPGLEAAQTVVTYSRDGTILSNTGPDGTLGDAVPRDRALSLLTSPSGTVFRSVTESGLDRTFAAVPIYNGVVYAIASWKNDDAGLVGAARLYMPWLFPIVMWLATLLVVYLALNRLVVRHVQNLGRRMRRFAVDRTLPESPIDRTKPSEFVQMNEDFRRMAEAIVQDEAQLENALREKTLLIREVHHRVKNNLQLIASIMNLQIRRTRNPETTGVVRRLQDRVLGLAAVHQRMYQAESLAEIPVDDLLEAILRQFVAPEAAGNARVSWELAPLTMTPDQAVPLALLVSEAAVNAVKYVGAAEGETPWIEIRLVEEGEEVRLTVENSVDPAAPSDNPAGLGSQLIRAFTSQLEARLVSEFVDGVHRLVVQFTPTVAIHEAYVPPPDPTPEEAPKAVGA